MNQYSRAGQSKQSADRPRAVVPEVSTGPAGVRATQDQTEGGQATETELSPGSAQSPVWVCCPLRGMRQPEGLASCISIFPSGDGIPTGKAAQFPGWEGALEEKE